jgi:hypothetical protein
VDSLSSEPSRPVGAAPVLTILAIGAVIRATLLWPESLWYDEATIGLMSLAVLRGDLPVYFYGQPFMGALDAYLAAPLYLALEPSARVLKIVPLALTLAWVGATVRLAWIGFGSRAALFTACLLAVPPDFLLGWSVEARSHYQLSVLLGTVALLLALGVRTTAPTRRVARMAVLGGLVGLAFWTNFLSVVFALPVALLLVGRRVRPNPAGILAAAAGFALGSLPHWLYGLQRGAALPPPGPRIGLVDLLHHLEVAGRVSWRIISGVPGVLHGTAGGMIIALGLAFVYALAAIEAVRTFRRDGPPAAPVALALLVLVLVNVGLAVGTVYGERLDDADQKYLLPVYTSLPVLLGRWLARRPARQAVLVAAGVLLVQAAGAVGGALEALRPESLAREAARLRADRDTIAALDRQGLRRLLTDDPGALVLTYLSRERVILSDPYQEGYPAYARAVDGEEAIGWWFRGARNQPFEASLGAMGVLFRLSPVLRGRVYAGFTLDAPPVVELDPGTFTATASRASETAGRAFDRDAVTMWSTPSAMGPADWFQVDLGRSEPVALIRWLPGVFQEVPRGLALETSLDGRTWDRRLELREYMGPLYWSAGRPVGWVRAGRVELRLGTPSPVRFLRIRQTREDPAWDWTIRELFVYALAVDAPPGARPTGRPSNLDGQTLARAVRSAGVRRLFADHGWGSRIVRADPEIRVVPNNLFVDAHGYAGKAANLLPPMRWRPGSGALLEPADVEGFPRLLRRLGLGFERHAIGDLTLVTQAPPRAQLGTPLPAREISVTASDGAGRAGLAADGDGRTSWAGTRPGRAGDWIRVDLARPRRVRALGLERGNPGSLPSEAVLDGSEDGVTWRRLPTETRWRAPLRWGGITGLADGLRSLRLDMTPTLLRALRVTVGRDFPGDPWAVRELTVYVDE